jgi:hypothetical protein
MRGQTDLLACLVAVVPAEFGFELDDRRFSRQSEPLHDPDSEGEVPEEPWRTACEYAIEDFA